MNTTGKAWENMNDFCQHNPDWKPISEIKDFTTLYKTWDELPAWERRFWSRRFGKEAAKEAWESLGSKPMRVDYAFIGADGIIYGSISGMPKGLGYIMIVRVGA